MIICTVKVVVVVAAWTVLANDARPAATSTDDAVDRLRFRIDLAHRGADTQHFQRSQTLSRYG
jgi:hypothetical protein